MAYLIINKDEDGLRHEMRSRYRGGMYRNDGYSPTMHEGAEHWYRKGYVHGHEDAEEEMDMRRSRDKMGRFI